MTTPASSVPLRRHPVFRLLWTADAVAQNGTFAATATLPLLAATSLGATPWQMGMLAATEMTGFLLFGLPAGAWIDRCRRRPVLIAADLARAGLLLAVPVAAVCGILHIAALIVVALLVGIASMFFDVAYQAYLPTAIGMENLEAGNANLQATQTIGQTAGPGLGGLLTQLAGPANALGITGLGYLTSAALIARIRVPEPTPPRPDVRASLRTDIAEGVRYIATHPQLRALAAASALAAFFSSGVLAVEVLFFTRDLHLDGFGTGVMLALSGVGGVAGAASTRRWTRRLGDRALWLVPLCSWPVHVLFPLARPGVGVLLAVVGILVFSAGATVYNVLSMTRRQELAPERLRGRVNASMRVIIWGPMVIGALAAGALADQIGTRTTLWCSVIGTVLAVVPLVASPLRESGPRGRS